MKNMYSSNFFKNSNVKLFVCAMSLLLPLTYSQVALSADNIANSKVAIKCHVLLVGGKEVISLWSVQQKKLQKLKDNIVGKKIRTPKSKQKIEIYQAYECVLEDDEFKSSKARLLDSKTPR